MSKTQESRCSEQIPLWSFANALSTIRFSSEVESQPSCQGSGNLIEVPADEQITRLIFIPSVSKPIAKAFVAKIARRATGWQFGHLERF